MIRNFEDALVWQKAKALAVDVYRLFGSHKDFGFRDQICRASISISNNIAEGLDRGSNKELKNFLYIAKGSCAEVRSMLHIASELGYISAEPYEHMVAETKEIAYMLSAFIKKLTL